MSTSVDGLCGACLMRLASLEARLDSATDPRPVLKSNGDGPLLSQFDDWLKVKGKRIGNYELLDEIARGGMGIVYRARQLAVGRAVALKVMLPHLLHMPGMLQRFRHEVEAAAQLDHPGVLPIYEVGEHAGLPFFSMKFAEGGSLDRRLASLHGEWTMIATLVARIARALEHAHRRGILHRDVKPANILFDAQGEPLVADFGLAKFRAIDRTLTLTGSALGSPQYMAPEQISAEFGAIGPATDVYGLGAVLYELLTERPPIVAEDALTTMRLVPTQQPQPGVHTRPDLPPDLDAIALKCLAKHPGERYSSAEEVALDLERWMATGAARARRESARGAGLRRWTLVPGIAAVAALAVLLAGYWGWERLRPASLRPERVMLAVLPLENLSGNQAHEYFSDGLTEEMITQLSRLQPQQLGVIARTSSMQYKGTKKRVDEIGRELGVAYILEGSVRRDGERVRISAQLVRVSDQAHLWAENYQRDIRDTLALQSDVADAVAREIRLKLTPEEQARSGRLRRIDPEAHQAYLKGLFFWNKRTRDGLEKAIEYFEEAVERDSQYALAYVGLANSYALLPVYGDFRPHEYYPRARTAALKALEMDDTLGQAHAALGVVKREHEWDHAGAEREYKQAIELSPNDATAHQWYAEYLALMDRPQEARAGIQRALELDPLSPIVNAIAGWVLFWARQYDEAIVQLQETIAMHPDFTPAHGYLAWAYDQNGMAEEAQRHYKRVVELSGGDPPLHLWQLEALPTSLKNAGAGRLAKLEQLADEGRVPAYYMATTYASAGDKERALQWLEKCFQQRDLSLLALKVDPWMDPLRSDVRFQDLLRRVGLSP